MKDILTEGWSDTKVALTEGLSGNRKAVLEKVLDNQRKYLMEQAPVGATSASHIAQLNKVILPVIRRVLPTVIANEIVGVQPMDGPVGQINTLRFRYAETVPANGTGVTAGTEALSPFDIARYYTGNENIANPGAAPTAQLEGVRGRQMNMQLIKEVVEAQTRRISATWTFESAQDAESQYGIDVEAEMLTAVAQEMTTEIDQEILLSLSRLAGAPAVTYNQANTSGVATYVGDEHAALAILINRQANLIAQRTRRQAANWAVVTPAALTVLQSAKTSAFARTTEGTFGAPTNTQLAGTLNGTMKIFVNNYSSDADPILIGLKMSEQEAAAYYCPYIPLQSTGVIIDPSNFMPVTGFATRYGYKALTSTANSLGNARDYVSSIGMTNLTFF